MAQTIQIKRTTGSTTPSGLAFGELAYVDGTGALWIGNNAAGVTELNAGSGTPVKFEHTVNQTTHGFVAGDVIRVSGAGTYTKAQANNAANAEVAGVVTENTDANNFKYCSFGFVTTGVPTATAGNVLFLSASTAGLLTETEPTAETDVSKPVAIVVQSATSMLVVNMRGVIKGTTSATGLGGLSDVTVTGQAIGDLIYANTASSWANLATGATSGHVLTSNGTGVAPSWQAAPGGGGLTDLTDVTLTTPDTGALLYKSAGDWIDLAAGSSTQVLIGGTAPAFGAVNLASMVTGTLDETNGGTGLASYTQGQLLYASGTTTLTTLAIGAAGTIMTSTGTAPQWSTYQSVIDVDLSLGSADTCSPAEWTSSFNSATALTYGDVVYLSASSTWTLADASAIGTAGGIMGVCIETVGSGGTQVDVMLRGSIRATALGTGTLNIPYYLSETAGDITSTAPTTASSITRVLGRFADTNTFWFAPEEGYVTHS